MLQEGIERIKALPLRKQRCFRKRLRPRGRGSAERRSLLMSFSAPRSRAAALHFLGISHAQRQFAQLLPAFGKSVRLQVEHQLQAVFGLAQEAVSIIEHAEFLISEAACSFEGLHGLEGVGLAELGKVAAVEELQELNGEFDVADATVSGLDLGLV